MKNKKRKKHMSLREIGRELWKNKFLYIMTLPGIAWIILFSYVPLYGILIAFKKYSATKGIWGSKWVGLDNFKFLFNYEGIGRIFFNTVFLNVLFIASGTAVSVILAILFSEIKNKRFKKVSQSVAIFPNFVSWTVISMILTTIIGSSGLVNNMLQKLGQEPLAVYSNPAPWPLILVLLKIWQGAGYGSIVYVATITGFDTGMYEAARVDGASRWQQITRITLPLMKPTIVLLTLMSVGGIFRGDFGMIYAIIGDSPKLYPTVDVIDTFTYRALRQLNDLGMSTATSFFQSLIGCAMVLVSNAIVKKVEPDSAIF